MKEYRNSIRSKRLLKAALIELLGQMDISKITVKTICDKSDLSRNTFYHHYEDVYAILDEIQGDIEQRCVTYLDTIIIEHDLSLTKEFFIEAFEFVANNLETIKVLLSNDTGGRFVERMKNVMIERAMKDNGSFNIADERGYRIFLEFLFSGAISLIQQYIYKKTNLTVDEIACESNRIFLAGYNVYARKN